MFLDPRQCFRSLNRGFQVMLGAFWGMCTFPNPGFTEPLAVTEQYGAPFVVYAQVDRSDGTYRRMLTSPEVLDEIQAGAPLPDGTRVLMETYYAPGELSTVFHKQKVDGRWEYGSFYGPGVVDLSTRPQASCLSCHSGAAETDFTYTHPLMEAARKVGVSYMTCSRGGRSPCSLQTYLDGVNR